MLSALRTSVLQLCRSASRVVQPAAASAEQPACGMKAILEKDKHQRNRFARAELKQMALRALTHNRLLPIQTRQPLTKKLWKATEMGRASKERVHNRCIYTNRGHSVYRDWRISRIKFREMALACDLPGVAKASW